MRRRRRCHQINETKCLFILKWWRKSSLKHAPNGWNGSYDTHTHEHIRMNEMDKWVWERIDRVREYIYGLDNVFVRSFVHSVLIIQYNFQCVSVFLVGFCDQIFNLYMYTVPIVSYCKTKRWPSTDWGAGHGQLSDFSFSNFPLAFTLRSAKFFKRGRFIFLSLYSSVSSMVFFPIHAPAHSLTNWVPLSGSISD